MSDAPRRLEHPNSFPNFDCQWHRTKDAIFENPLYGTIRHRVVVTQSGTPLYDCPQVIEPPGAACLPITSAGEIALVSIYRPMILRSEPQGTFPNYNLTDFGVWLWEAPGGFCESTENPSQAVSRELFEETGLTVETAEHVGRVVLGGGIMATPIELYIATVSGTAVPQQGEGIYHVAFFSPAAIWEMVRSGKIAGGITLALLAHLFARQQLSKTPVVSSR